MGDFVFTCVGKTINSALNQGYTIISEQGSSRSGKTYNTTAFLVCYLMNNPNTSLSIVRATLPALKGSVYRDFKTIMQNFGIWQDRSMNKSEMVYTFSNGSFVEFFSCDDEQKLRGRGRDILFVNEANEILNIDWVQLKMRTNKFAIMDYNPSFSDEHWINGVNKKPQTYHFITTYKDNKYLPQVIIDEIESLRDQNESLWRVYGLGLQAIVEGLIFPQINIVNSIPENIQETQFVGMDFGYTNDPTAIIRVFIHRNELWIDEICYATKMLASDIIETIKSNCKKERIISESADKRLVDEIYNADIDIIPVRKFSGSIEAGILKMKEYKINITKNSFNVIKEFKNYTYKQDKEGKWTNKPIDAYNHAIDAIRYVILEEVLGKEKKSSASQILGYF